MSHELRTPLTAMLGWARLLRMGKLDPAAAAKALEAIERNTLLQARLIEDILDVSRIVVGTLSLDAHPVMVAPAVQAALDAVRAAAEAKGVVLESALDKKAGPVRGDPIALAADRLEPRVERHQVHAERGSGRGPPRAPGR